MKEPVRFGWLLPAVYVGFIAIPILWLVRVSLAPGAELRAGFSLFPAQATLQNYQALFAADGWMRAFGMGLVEAAGSAALAVIAALPAAYAFARFRFAADRPLLFWMFAARLVPLAAIAGPAGGLYASLGLADAPVAVALAHGLFNLPVAVWIIEAAIRASPRRIDETADMDGYIFPGFFFEILLPLIARSVAAAAAVCFILSWTETAIAGALTASIARPIGPRIAEAAMLANADLGVLAAAAVLTLLPGAALVWFMRRHIAGGFAMGRS